MSKEKVVVVHKSKSVGKSVALSTVPKAWSKQPRHSTSTGVVQGYRNFYGHGEHKFYVYPDSGWDEKKWGPKPCLGIIWADGEFYAVREAYSKGLAPVNQTFGLVASMNQQQ